MINILYFVRFTYTLEGDIVCVLSVVCLVKGKALTMGAFSLLHIPAQALKQFLVIRLYNSLCQVNCSIRNGFMGKREHGDKKGSFLAIFCVSLCTDEHFNSYSASHDNWCTATLWNRIMTAQCEGMGEVGSARYEPALLPPCPSIRVLSYSNCQEIHSRRQTGLAV